MATDQDFESLVLQKASEVHDAIEIAKHVGEVISVLHSLAVRLFPTDSSLVAGEIDEPYRSQVLNIVRPSEADRNLWKQAFYCCSAFRSVAMILVNNVASKWLASFTTLARKEVYDSFFLRGPSTEVIQILVPELNQKTGYNKFDLTVFHSNIERLLILVLLDNCGVYHMVGEFCEIEGGICKTTLGTPISIVAQLLSSIPDKASPGVSAALQSHSFFQKISSQLFDGVEGRAEMINCQYSVADNDIFDPAFLFVGETICRLCRRGSADIVVAEMIPRILTHLRSCVQLGADAMIPDTIQSSSLYYLIHVVETMRDPYSVEILLEVLLRRLVSQNISDSEAYWVLWIFLHRSLASGTTMRDMLVEKFMLRKVFPVCCLRWLLELIRSTCPTNSNVEMKCSKTSFLLRTVERFVSFWSKREFVQSFSLEKQAYLTAAIGLCLEKMSRVELETTKDVSNSILQGVSCRLESPIDLVRKMACAIALVFSQVVDPSNPLYLDDFSGEQIDWEFGILIPNRLLVAPTSRDTKRMKDSNFSPLEQEKGESGERDKDCGGSESTPAVSTVKDDDDESTGSCDSLEPYDIVDDDDVDLSRKFSQLSEISAALGNRNDPDAVEGALSVTEKLVRASPPELPHICSDLVRALLHLRCSDVAVHGVEDTVEEKRQRALVALLVTCPFESLQVTTKLLYSSGVDVAQRILIIDVMIDAALELADTRVLSTGEQRGNLVSSTSPPWFVPSFGGPLGVGPWTDVSDRWSHRYERYIPSKLSQAKSGKSRRWGLRRSEDSEQVHTKNIFPLYAAAFMLPMMQGFEERKHRVNLLGRDFIVLGKLLYMLGICMKCLALHPEAFSLALPLLDMIRSRDVSHHVEAYVRRSAVFAASCILFSLHPSCVASVLVEGDHDVSGGLEWIRSWAFGIADSDVDTECKSMAMTCLQLHSEMVLKTSRALEAADRSVPRSLPSHKLDSIVIPFSNMR